MKFAQAERFKLTGNIDRSLDQKTNKQKSKKFAIEWHAKQHT